MTNENAQTSRRPTWRVIGAAIIIALVLAGLLALDLNNRGRIWTLFWQTTGEEDPIAQIRGMLQWTGNFTRQMPRTQPITPINHTNVNPFGINTFLEQEVEPAKREQQVRMIADVGFGWIRQEFPWEDIEIHGRGDFEDRRNDLDGDGEIDAISAWDKYDNIVDLAEQYGLRMQVRLSNPPEWTHSNPDIGDFAPPDDLQDYVNFAVTVAERYKGRIHHYQIWNEPNIFPEWGNQDVSPEGYTELLCRTYDALKAVDPEIVVISGALAPTVSLTRRNLNDFIFLQLMYQAGAGDCFDILSMQGYGLNSGPTDRRMRITTVNYARNLYIRDQMIANGDAHKPIWISEAAWNPVPDPDEVADINARYNFGQVTEEQAARFMPIGYQRMLEEWPWVGVMNYWFFKRATDFEANQSFYYFRMVEPDFTPLPVFDTMREYLNTMTPTLYQGVHQADDWAITLPDDAESVMVDDAQFGDAMLTHEVTFIAHGTDVLIRWRGAGELQITPPPNPLPVHREGEMVPASQWRLTKIASSRTAQAHTIHITADEPFILDSVTVLNRSTENQIAFALPLVLVVGLVAGFLGNTLRIRLRG